MYHPQLMYELAKLRIAEDLRQAERERLVRQAGSMEPSGSIDSVQFRERLTRLFDAIRPSIRDGVAPTGA
ncbi:MAG: hypothetical protein A2V85_02345 [Chloroflexi bacterium RBG_16_72_14]|nr:MAG: hypothetical protein A2V85_02345 [Chloroflexi bacterium RBG_16_72_14]